MTIHTFVQVAVPVPLRQLFTYSIPQELQSQTLVSGQLVEVPFGNRHLVAMVIETNPAIDSTIDLGKIKPITRVFTHQHQLPQSIIKLLHTAANYYSHPIGEVIQYALPVLMRQEEPEPLEQITYWRTTSETLEAGLEQINVKRSPKQGELFALLFSHTQLTWPEIRTLGFSKTQLEALVSKALIEPYQKPIIPLNWDNECINTADKHHLTAEQAITVSSITTTLDQYACHLVHGITGSGKTEVYLQVMEQVLAKSKQVLVLVPEIGLTPQMLARFEQRFNVPIFLHHSGLNDKERFTTWCQAHQGQAAIVIGTRSALFTPLAQLGLIIVDEEHDTSFKQQDSFRYNGRDLAIVRANQGAIPIVLGSATPSFESLANANSGKYFYHQLTQRPGKSVKAKLSLVDINNQQLSSGLAASTIRDIEQVLARKEQVLVFLNRRGFAPAINCKECHWVADCTRCNRPYTLHKNQGLLICHHCNSQKRIPHQCPSCGSIRLTPVGQGTEQVEQWLEQHFNDKSIVRIDRDSTRRKGELAKRLEQINQGEHHILIGTQMLAKGHHFPNVTLVVMLDIDGALFSFDYRAAEHMAQQLEQVAGRAGRASKPGKVLIQTQYPQHPLLMQLVSEGYSEFAKQGLEERQWAKLPPFGHQALIRAEANKPHLPEQFLRDISQLSFGSDIAGPMPAAMEKKAGKFRFHLLFQAANRKVVHQDLHTLIAFAKQHPLANKVRWSIDVDPIDLSW
ncbi:primosomal protein N' [Thalassotalea marina]|uniref:Replication restart protein PriA n=1 Tax=Thalassotalea marina TaxID=1673741 RepID=A0A919EH38_9GAMM|nr:primosomal protein N' [Thalassotalea marina]GHF82371.1 primosomal protein N' [Thalassotalea marina]